MHELMSEQLPWPGAHKVAKEPSYFREYTNRRGMPWKVALPLLSVRHAGSNSGFSDHCLQKRRPPPNVAVRKQLWRELRQKAVKRTKPPPKNKRPPRKHPAAGQRIGEATNPGPVCKAHPLTIWSINISSWCIHGAASQGSFR